MYIVIAQHKNHRESLYLYGPFDSKHKAWLWVEDESMIDRDCYFVSVKQVQSGCINWS